MYLCYLRDGLNTYTDSFQDTMKALCPSADDFAAPSSPEPLSVHSTASSPIRLAGRPAPARIAAGMRVPSPRSLPKGSRPSRSISQSIQELPGDSIIDIITPSSNVPGVETGELVIPHTRMLSLSHSFAFSSICRR